MNLSGNSFLSSHESEEERRLRTNSDARMERRVFHVKRRGGGDEKEKDSLGEDVL